MGKNQISLWQSVYNKPWRCNGNQGCAQAPNVWESMCDTTTGPLVCPVAQTLSCPHALLEAAAALAAQRTTRLAPTSRQPPAAAATVDFT